MSDSPETCGNVIQVLASLPQYRGLGEDEAAQTRAVDRLRGAGTFTWKGKDGIVHRSTFAGSLLKPREVYWLGWAQGWRGAEQGAIFVATMRGESGFYTKAILEYGESTERFIPSGEWDAGLCQINNRATPGVTLEEVYDPHKCVEIAWQKFIDRDREFTPWYAYVNGAYKRFWRQAVKGMANYWVRQHVVLNTPERKPFI